MHILAVRLRCVLQDHKTDTQKFTGPEPSLGDSRQNINNRIKRWVDNRHLAMWCCPCSTQTQARKLISGPSPPTRAQLLSSNKTHNSFRRHIYLMELSSNPTFKKCGTEEETSVHVLCECVALTSLRHACLVSFFMDPEDVTNLIMGAIWNFGKGTGLH